MKELGLFILAIMLMFIAFCINSCQCGLRAGNGIKSHYNPLIGCEFEIDKE